MREIKEHNNLELLQFVAMASTAGNGKTKWPYRNTYDLVYKEGIFFNEVVECPPEWTGALGDCFRNCTCLIIDHDRNHYKDEGALAHFEGVAASKLGVPMFHAWLQDANGRVIDPTWDDGIAYFGVHIPSTYLVKEVLRTGYYGIIDNYRMEFKLITGEDNYRELVRKETAKWRQKLISKFWKMEPYQSQREKLQTHITSLQMNFSLK